MRITTETTEIARGIFAVLRDFALLVLLIVLIAWPRPFLDHLRASGVESMEWLGFKLALTKKETLDVAQQVNDSSRVIEDSKLRLYEMLKAHPELAPSIGDTTRELDDAGKVLAAADQRLRDVVVSQQSVAQAAASNIGIPAPKLSGWMYLGTVDGRQTKWTGNDHSSNLTWPIAVGATGRIDEDAYIRADPKAASYREARLIGVAKSQSSFDVQRVEIAPALPNGLRPVWARVTID